MDLQAAIKIIEESPGYERYSTLKKVFRDRVEQLQETDYTERGICNYYLLRIVLRSHLMYETEECREYFDSMNKDFKEQLKKYKRDAHKFDKNEIDDFFRLMERSYSSLEIIFRKKDFLEEERWSYKYKMDYRKMRHWFKGHYWDWFEYAFLGITSNYGNSFVRWGSASMLFAILMSVVYYATDMVTFDPLHRIVQEGGHWYDYFYFSVITLTSVGFGDLIPFTFIGKIFVSIEAFFGFIMLGIFISLIQKRL